MHTMVAKKGMHKVRGSDSFSHKGRKMSSKWEWPVFALQSCNWIDTILAL